MIKNTWEGSKEKERTLAQLSYKCQSCLTSPVASGLQMPFCQQYFVIKLYGRLQYINR